MADGEEKVAERSPGPAHVNAIPKTAHHLHTSVSDL